MTNESSKTHHGINLGGASPLESIGESIGRKLDPFGVTTSLLNAQMAWLMHPQELLRAMNALSGDVIALQAHVARRAWGLPSEDVVVPVGDDARFVDPVWSEALTRTAFRTCSSRLPASQTRNAGARPSGCATGST